jgi:hypothetical protein
VDADADHVAGLNLIQIHRCERLVNEAGVAKAAGRRRRQHIQPARSNDRGPKRNITWIDEVNTHAFALLGLWALPVRQARTKPTLDALKLSKSEGRTTQLSQCNIDKTGQN